MLPRHPEDWPAAFTHHLEARDLDGIAALYEPDARFVAPSGETIVGRERIRAVLAGLIESKARLRSRVVRAVTTDDVAVLYTDFDGIQVAGSGKTIEFRSRVIEVLRRQSDGTWKLIVGDPNGRVILKGKQP